MAKLDAEQLRAALQGMRDWEGDTQAIRRTYRFDSFMPAIAFVNRVAEAAEAVNHHPDIDIRYNRVTIALSTHDEGGVTDKDVELARRIDGLAG